MKKPWMALIWKNFIPPKHAFVVWMAMRNRLNTMDRWIYLEGYGHCVFCNNHCETSSHLFFKCSFVQAIWRRVRVWLSISRAMTTLLSSIKWIKREYGGARIRSKAILLDFEATIYFDWSARNQRMFVDHADSVDSIFQQIKIHVYSILYLMYPVKVITF